MPTGDKLLARDRDDWRKGRRISRVDGLVVGNTTIHFGTVVVASGEREAEDPFVFANVGLANKYYGLIAEIRDTCPPRPSGLGTSGTQCLAMIEMLCDAFPEDEYSYYHPEYTPSASSECTMLSAGLVWGRNFVADEELVSVVGGMYGLVRPRVFSGKFLGSAILAALFALGTVELRPSKIDIVRPQINWIYVVFMLSPILVCFLLPALAFALRHMVVPIPQSNADILVLAKEADPDVVPIRPGKRGTFPSFDKDELALVFFDANEDESGPDIGVVRFQKTPSSTFEQPQDVKQEETQVDVVKSPCNPIMHFKPESAWLENENSTNSDAGEDDTEIGLQTSSPCHLHQQNKRETQADTADLPVDHTVGFDRESNGCDC